LSARADLTDECDLPIAPDASLAPRLPTGPDASLASGLPTGPEARARRSLLGLIGVIRGR
jgi:hypothetical protein